MKLIIPGPSGPLEAIITEPEAAPRAVGVVCHPDPRQEGTMHNKVVTTVARAFDKMGLATVRFNFRGVGESAGVYGDAVGELADLTAVVDWAQQRYLDCPLWLAGFSFGSFIAASFADQHDVAQLVTIAPPVHHYDYTTLTHINCPWLLIQGDADEVVPPDAVFDFAKAPPSPLRMIVMKEVGHFFHGRLIELRELLMEEFSAASA